MKVFLKLQCGLEVTLELRGMGEVYEKIQSLTNELDIQMPFPCHSHFTYGIFNSQPQSKMMEYSEQQLLKLDKFIFAFTNKNLPLKRQKQIMWHATSQCHQNLDIFQFVLPLQHMAPSQGTKWMFKLYLSLQIPSIRKEEGTKKGAPPYFRDFKKTV